MPYTVIYITVLAIFICVGLLIKVKNIFPLLVILDFIISIPSYFVHSLPGAFADMDRFNLLLDQMRLYNEGNLSNGLSWALNQSYYSEEKGSALYIWIYSLFKNNGFLRLGTTFLFLVLLSFLIVRFQKDANISNVNAIIGQFLFLLVFNLFYEISGIRNFLAFMIMSVGLYYDLNDKNKKTKVICFLAYYLAYSIHSSMLPIIIIRILLLFKNRIAKFIISFLILTYNVFLTPLLSVFNQLGLVFFVEKANYYIESQSQNESFTSTIELGLTSFIFLLLIICYILYVRNYKRYLSIKYNRFYYYIILYIIGSIGVSQVYLRTIFFLLFLSMPYILVMLSNKITNNYIKLYSLCFKISAFLIFLGWSYISYNNVLVY